MSIFDKDIRFMDEETIRLSTELALRRWAEIKADAPGARDSGHTHMMAISAAGAQVEHRERGAQLWVTRQVSNDLLLSDVSEPCFENIKWPHTSLEVYFEDPALPSMLTQLTTPRRILDITVGRLYGDEVVSKMINPAVANDEKLAIIIPNRNVEVPFTLLMAEPGSMDLLLSGAEVKGKLQSATFAAYSDEVSFMALLLFKVLLFATSRGHAPRVTKEKPTKNQGGKPGFKGRPHTKRLIVEYLPEQRVIRAPRPTHGTAIHEFKGRRGHWGHYQADKYVNKKGAWDYINPVPGPDGTYPEVRFVVRKPK